MKTPITETRNKRKHIIIAGPGRSGSTFLIQLFTHLGLDTGYHKDKLEDEIIGYAHAGLEQSQPIHQWPHIVKCLWLADEPKSILNNQDIHIERLIIPLRELSAAAESRRFVEKEYSKSLSLIQRLKNHLKRRHIGGGLWKTKSPKAGVQECVLSKIVYEQLLAISEAPVPVTVLRYPRLAKDSGYLYKMLEPMLVNINYKSFHLSFEEVSHLDYIHSFNAQDV